MGDLAPVITAHGLTKRYGAVTAVDGLDFELRPGTVTGFLGPNGAGKTTTIRMLLGLVRPTSGSALVRGQTYDQLERPMNVVGAALDGAAAHPSHTGLGHLRVLAPHAGVSDARCREVLELVGLTAAARRKVGGYSFGMRQRLALAASLLGDPRVLVLDEPALGLDPDGIQWLWQLLPGLARQGRTVFVSSHSLTDMQDVLDDVLIISRGRLRFHGRLDELRGQDRTVTIAETPDPQRLRLLASEKAWQTVEGAGGVHLVDVSPGEVGALAFRAGIEIHGLRSRTTSLSDSYFRLTSGDTSTEGEVA